MRAAWLVVGCAWTACGDDRRAIGLSDVTVLFPPPDATSLRLDTAGAGGPLLSTNDYALADPLVTIDYATWRIVSARIDPCFPNLANLDDAPGKCARQLRLVAQPVTDAGVSDDGMHLLYEFSPAEFDVLARAWVAVGTDRTQDPATPLGVHPEIAAQGTSGPIATALRALIVAHAGPATLAKLTFVASTGDTGWQFGAFHADGDVPGAALVPSEIPTIGTADPSGGLRQVTQIDKTGAFSIAPGSMESDGLAPLAAPAGDLTAAVQDSLDLDNPTRTHVDGADCSGCHVAGRARERALALGGTTGTLAPYADSGKVFDLSLQLPDTVRQSTAQQRGLGYNGRTAVWSQRVVNDSAEVADSLAAVLAQ